MKPRLRAVAGAFLAALLGLAGGLLLTAGLIAAQGKSVSTAFHALLDGSIGSAFAVGTTLNRAAVLLLVALAFSIALRGGLVNIGTEGQLYCGGAAAAICVLTLGGGVPSVVLIVAGLVAGVIGGALWAVLAGVLRERLGANEVVSTLLLNFVAIQLVALLVQEPSLFREPSGSTTSFPQSEPIPLAGRLPQILPAPSRAHLGVVLALLAAIVVSVMLRRTSLGFRVRMYGNNPALSRRAGYSGLRMTSVVMALSGALAGLAGTLVVMGEQYRLRADFSPGFGYQGIAVALVARSSPIGAIPAALLFAGLQTGGAFLEARVQVSQAIVLVLQGLVITIVAIAAQRISTGRGLSVRSTPKQPEVEVEAA